jgi:hypothetical protein
MTQLITLRKTSCLPTEDQPVCQFIVVCWHHRERIKGLLVQNAGSFITKSGETCNNHEIFNTEVQLRTYSVQSSAPLDTIWSAKCPLSARGFSVTPKT